MTEIIALLVVATLAVLQHRADQRRLDDAFKELASAQRQLRAQADPATYAWTGPEPAYAAEAAEPFYLTDASGLFSVEVGD